MATKTITIDMAAYERLKAVQRGNESFSQVIKRVIVQPLDFQRFLKGLRKTSMSEEAIQAVETHVQKRHSPSGRDR